MPVDEFTNVVKLKMEEPMIFKCDLGLKDEGCYIDELHEDKADMVGPSPSMLLASAVLGCLSSSFIFCLKKKNMRPDLLEAEAEVKGSRNEKGFMRVNSIKVKLKAKTDDEKVKSRMQSCLKIFEQFCTVTQSVRKGIPVDVDVEF